MSAARLFAPAPIETAPLQIGDIAPPPPGPGQVLLRVRACGVCRTDLHLTEGDLPLHHTPLTPGHQVVGFIEQLGEGVTAWQVGDRVGVPWLGGACGTCAYCMRGQENLCDHAHFTGWDSNGGYAHWMVARADFVVALPPRFSDQQAAPLLCAGIIGYRALRLAEVQPGEHVGLFGLGASAHLALQLARHWGCTISVFTRNPKHRDLAESLGASWVGPAEAPSSAALDRIILFAPSGELVPLALRQLRKGGTLAINAIHLTPIPVMDYHWLYGERTIRSVTNATRKDAVEWLQWAAQMPLTISAQVFPLAEANQALRLLKHSQLQGAAVLDMNL